MRNKVLLISLIMLMFTGSGIQAWAHAPDQSYVFLNVEDTRVTGHIDMSVSDINLAMGVGLTTDRLLDLSDLAPHRSHIENYLREHVKLAVDSGTAGLPLTKLELSELPNAQYVQFYFAFEDLQQEPTVIHFEYSVLFDKNPNHRGMAVIETQWKTGTFNNEAIVSLIFEPGKEQQSLALDQASVWTGLLAQVRSGIHHIWIGIDHILFLLALLLPAVVTRTEQKWEAAASFKEAFIHVVKIVTIFTIAHTITLSLAALNAISLSSRLIESIIAISITVAAFDILRPIFKRRIWWIVFVFGLFHGFGFASVLGEIGIPANYMVHSLLGFNVGVEIGQLVIVAVLFPVLFLLARYRMYAQYLLPAGSTALIVISLYWFIERAFEIDLPAGAIVNSVVALFS